jgi:hypothetical protein
MVVLAAWHGASVEDTLKQVTERLERKLQETPKLDFLRSLTRAGVTTIFVNLLGSTTAWEVPDIWYHVRKSIGDIRHTLPAGILGPGFNADARLAIDAKYRLGRIGKAAANLRDVAEAQHASADSEVDGAHVLLGAEGARHPQGQRLAAGLDRAGGKHDVLRLQGTDQRGPVEAEAGEFLHGELDKDPLAIPLTFAIVFSVIDLARIDMQRISLGALIIALALLVDDAMTTTDAMLTRLAQGDDKVQAATFAFRTYAFAMLAGTLVTIAGFVPVGFAASSAGEYTFSLFAVRSSCPGSWRSCARRCWASPFWFHRRAGSQRLLVACCSRTGAS